MNASDSSIREGSLRRDGICLAFLLGVFLISRWWAVRVGVEAGGGLPHLQVADRDLLQNDLLRTLFYLHIQPPLFNGLVGLLLKLPLVFTTGVSLTYKAFGLLLAATMFLLLRRLEVGRVWACAGTALFIISPACLLYETFTIYTYPVALALLAATFFVHRYAASGRKEDALAASLLVASAALMRSLLHLAWVVGALFMVMALARSNKRRAVWLLMPAIVLVSSVYIKNLVVFGTFGTSTLMGQSLYRIATQMVDFDERLRLVEEGQISPFIMMAPNRPISLYPLATRPPDQIDFGSWEDRAFLAQGWSRESEGRGQFRWSVADRSILVVPIAAPSDLGLRIRCAPFTYPGAPRQSIAVRVAGQEVAMLELDKQVSTYSVTLPGELLRPGLNAVTFQYGFAHSPRELGLSKDSRSLAVRWHGIELTPVPGTTMAGVDQPRWSVDIPARVPDVPVLTRVSKQDGGGNPNHGYAPALMRRYVADAVELIRRFPRQYLGSVAKAYLISLAPPTEHPAFRQKRRLIERWDRLYSAVIYGAANSGWGNEHSHQSRRLPVSELLKRVSWLYLLAALVLIPYTLWSCWKSPSDAGNIALLFALVTVAWIIVVGNFLDFGENNRFRMQVEPLIWVVFVTSFSRGTRALGLLARRLRTELSSPSHPT